MLTPIWAGLVTPIYHLLGLSQAALLIAKELARHLCTVSCASFLFGWLHHFTLVSDTVTALNICMPGTVLPALIRSITAASFSRFCSMSQDLVLLTYL